MIFRAARGHVRRELCERAEHGSWPVVDSHTSRDVSRCDVRRDVARRLARDASETESACAARLHCARAGDEYGVFELNTLELCDFYVCILMCHEPESPAVFTYGSCTSTSAANIGVQIRKLYEPAAYRVRARTRRG